MAELTLVYREDPATGLPRLEVPNQELAAKTLTALEQQLHHRFQELVASADEQIIALDGDNGPTVPSHYRVSVRWQEGQRCPTLVLAAVEKDNESRVEEGENLMAPKIMGGGSWLGQFFSELADLLPAEEIGEKQSALHFVLADLRAIRKKNPKILSLLLLAGYLQVGDGICRAHGATAETRYEEAARWLKKMVGDQLPQGAFATLLE